MAAAVESTCEKHPDRFDCPDALIHYSTRSDGYGLIVHDGGSSVIGIGYCPWCGAVLASSEEES
jgi:hypothetical protein